MLVILVLSLRGIAGFYTNYLWFNSVNEYGVWKTTLITKIELGSLFVGLLFVFLWVNMTVAHKMAPSDHVTHPEDELLHRYQQIVVPRAKLYRTVIALVVSLVVGLPAVSQWQNWLLYEHSQPFGKLDPQFHMDVSFFVFKLPFLKWLVGWLFAALLVSFLVSAVIHYLNGGIRLSNAGGRVTSSVKAHLSLLLGLIALEKAAAYEFVSRPSLELSNRGVVQGASYTDIHIQLPAITLLSIISIASAVIFLVNIYRRGWVLPVVAVLLWGFVALVAGIIYPAIVQSFKVQPAQSTLELPYITRNISATQYAMGLTNIQSVSFPGSQDVTTEQLANSATSLNDVRLWDWEYTLQVYDKYQAIKNYYQFNTLAYDRYMVNGSMVPVVVGVRQINSGDLPDQTWVNQHLQFTHGYGAIISPASSAASNGSPNFPTGDIPVNSQNGYPTIKQPEVYFGAGQYGYVVADTAQAELDYPDANGNPVETHYNGNGGVPMGSLLRKAAYALDFGDYNLLFSSLITSKSQIIYNADIHTRVAQVAPFLSLDADPYPVVLNGTIYWVQDAYTTTDSYPYAQSVSSGSVNALNPQSDLAQKPFNYIRNSVKVLVNAYTGKMTFYVVDPSDPIIKAWESIYPNLFTPASQISPSLRQHLRYPEDLMAVQSGMYGRYHISNAVDFYNASDAWMVSQAASAATNSGGNQPTTATPIDPNNRYSPSYQVMQLPGQSTPGFYLVEPFVPTSASGGGNSKQQILSAFLVAGSDPNDYGKLEVYVTPRGQSINGPAFVSSLIMSVPNVSREITLLSQQGSTVTMGTVEMLPIYNSLLYIRPMYVSSSSNPIPTLKFVIVVYGNNVAMETTLGQALFDVFNVDIPGVTSTLAPGTSVSSGSSTNAVISAQVQQLLAQAQAASAQAQVDLAQGNLGAYQNDENTASSDVSQALSLLGKGPTAPSSSGSIGAHGSTGTTTSTSTTTNPNAA